MFLRFIILSLAQVTTICQTPAWAPSLPNVTIGMLSTTVHILSNVAKTSLELHIDNPSSRIAEGQLVLPLPAGASVNQYALDFDGKFRWAVPVDKQRATEVMESSQTQGVSSGLVQQLENSNNFRVRIFPIPAGGSRKIIIGYNQQLAVDDNDTAILKLKSGMINNVRNHSVTINLMGLPNHTISQDRNGAQLTAYSTGKIQIYSLSNQTGMVELTVWINITARYSIYTHFTQGRYYFYGYILLSKQDEPKKAAAETKIAILWDNSLSCLKRDLSKQLALLRRYLDRTKHQVVVYTLSYYLVRLPTVFNMANTPFSELQQALRNITYDGATKYSQIVLQQSYNEILFFTDGISTLSNSTMNSNSTVYTISSNLNVSVETLRTIAHSTNGQYIDLAAMSVESALAKLQLFHTRLVSADAVDYVDSVYPQIDTIVENRLFSITGRTDSLPTRLILNFGTNVITETVSIELEEQDTSLVEIHKLWAEKVIQHLSVNYQQNEEQINSIGNKFGIVTRSTSLVVLSSVEQYFKYGVRPPEELTKQFNTYARGVFLRKQQQTNNGLSKLKKDWDNFNTWWNKPPRTKKQEQDLSNKNEDTSHDPNQNAYNYPLTSLRGPIFRRRVSFPEGMVLPTYNIAAALNLVGTPISSAPRFEPLIPSAASGDSTPSAPARPAVTPIMPQVNESPRISRLDRNGVSGAQVDTDDQQKLGTTFPEESEYLSAVNAKGTNQQKYQEYLSLRAAHLNNPAFYLDIAELFQSRNRTIALLILSNVAELSLENAALYRTLASYFRQYQAYSDTLTILQKVAAWRHFQPQSYRDLALAYQNLGNMELCFSNLQKSLNASLLESVQIRSSDLNEVLLMDINRIVQKYGNEVFAGKLPAHYLQYLSSRPVELRIVMSWNQNNVDLDLLVMDPDGEVCYYGMMETPIGGRLSKDMKFGLGPEQFLLKKASRGTYKVRSKYYSESRLTNNGPMTLTLEVYKLKNGNLSTTYRTVQMRQIKQNQLVDHIQF